MPTLYYLGPEGTHSHVAANAIARFFPEIPFRLVQSPTIAQVIRQVVECPGGFGCIPLENSIQGSVTMAWDGLLTHADEIELQIAWTITIEHYLLTIPGADVTQLHTVFSHPQGLAQCKDWLAVNVPKVSLQEVSSTAASAVEVKRLGDRGTAGIGSRMLGELYELEVSKAAIQDQSDNLTRFGLISSTVLPHDLDASISQTTYEDGDYQWTMSICLRGVGNQPGGLVAALIPFQETGFNLSRIESRPVGDNLGVYVFYLDITTPLVPTSTLFSDKWLDVSNRLSQLGVEVIRLGVYPNVVI